MVSRFPEIITIYGNCFRQFDYIERRPRRCKKAKAMDNGEDSYRDITSQDRCSNCNARCDGNLCHTCRSRKQCGRCLRRLPDICYKHRDDDICEVQVYFVLAKFLQVGLYVHRVNDFSSERELHVHVRYMSSSVCLSSVVCLSVVGNVLR